ncbi:MAG: hypothetical protein Q9186_001762 [Xanthomendoza sp. 1 TL-2023]
MPLVSSTTPSRKEQGTQFPEKAGSSWSRHWIDQHPPKPSKAEVTFQPLPFISAEEKYPSLTTVDKISALHQILPLYPLPSIVEVPKQEVLLKERSEPESPAPPVSLKAERSTSQDSDQPMDLKTSEAMDYGMGKIEEVEGNSRVANTRPLSPISEAASVPLPTSPASENSPKLSDIEGGLGSAQQLHPHSDKPAAEAAEPVGEPKDKEQDTWTSRLNSLLPNAIMDRPSRQGTDIPTMRASRSSSIAPGAYPESDSTDESLRQNQVPATEDEQVESSQPKSDPRSDDKSVRPRKSVSIVLPDERNAPKTERKDQADSTGSPMDRGDDSSRLGAQSEHHPGTEVTHDSMGTTTARNDDPQAEHEITTDSKAFVSQAGEDVSPRLLQTPSRRDSSLTSRTSSIAPSHDDTDRTDMSTLHERQSLAPSDADNSSLKPLLSSSPRDAGSTRFSESLDESGVDHITMASTKRAKNTEEKGTTSPSILNDLSSHSYIDFITGSTPEQSHQQKHHEESSPPLDSGEASSKATSSLPPPKIVVKDASSTEDSMHTPSLVAPTTTPVQEGSLPTQRRTTFVALGEPLDHERAIKLPMKRRKLLIRKTRYAVLRQPILNAVLGRQIGGQAKLALKKLANGELIVVEPPTNL